MSKQAAGNRIRLPAPQALRRCNRLLTDGTGFDTPAGYLARRWRNWTARPASNREGRGSSPRRRTQDPCSVGGTGQLTWPSTRRLRVQAPHRARNDGPIVYGLGSRPFKSRNGVRLPVGLQRVTAPVVLNGLIIRDRWVRLPHPPRRLAVRPGRYWTAKRGISFRCPLTVNEQAVNLRLLVRIQVPELW